MYRLLTSFVYLTFISSVCINELWSVRLYFAMLLFLSEFPSKRVVILAIY